MAHILLVNPNELITKLSEELKQQKLVQPPDWSKFVRTGQHKARFPEDEDWWYIRSAAILRSIAKLGPIGTQKLRTKYGGKKRRGYLPEHFYKASGSIIRKILQQLETSQLIQQTEKSGHKGRILTGKGQSLLNKIALHFSKDKN